MNSLADEVTEKPRRNSLHAQKECSIAGASLNIFTEDDGHLLLVVSLPGHHGTEPVTTRPCAVNLTSLAGKSISAVLLEHSPCAGGVFVLLWDKVTRKRWDMCSTWHAPGPAFMTSSTNVGIIVELLDVSDSCHFNISAMAVVKPTERELELRYLSATEGKVWVGEIDRSLHHRKTAI